MGTKNDIIGYARAVVVIGGKNNGGDASERVLGRRKKKYGSIGVEIISVKKNCFFLFFRSTGV